MKLRARREEDKARREAAILKAGREVWSHKPAGEFTMTAVAERAGVVKGTVYLYFPTKEDLLETVSEGIVGETLDRVDRALEPRKRWTLAKIAELFSEGVKLPVLPRSAAVRERIATTAERIDARVSGLHRGDAALFLVSSLALLAGLGSAHGEFRSGVIALAHGIESGSFRRSGKPAAARATRHTHR